MRTLQSGGHTLRPSTANALNRSLELNKHRRERGRALERLKEAHGKASNWHEGKILADGSVADRTGKVIDSLLDYLF